MLFPPLKLYWGRIIHPLPLIWLLQSAQKFYRSRVLLWLGMVCKGLSPYPIWNSYPLGRIPINYNFWCISFSLQLCGRKGEMGWYYQWTRDQIMIPCETQGFVILCTFDSPAWLTLSGNLIRVWELWIRLAIQGMVQTFFMPVVVYSSGGYFKNSLVKCIPTLLAYLGSK